MLPDGTCCFSLIVHVIHLNRTEVHRWMDGWIVILRVFFFSSVFQSYQEDGREIMKSCVQWSPFTVK